MAVNIVNHLNTELDISAQAKQDMLDDFCAQYGYQEEIDGEPNPTSKADFANEKINQHIVQTINAWRKKQAEEQISYSEFSI